MLIENSNRFLAKKSMQDNLLAVNIYYKTLEVTEVKQNPSLTWFQVLSDLGGALGLCLGASIVTAFEFIEFFDIHPLFFSMFQKNLSNDFLSHPRYF